MGQKFDPLGGGEKSRYFRCGVTLLDTATGIIYRCTMSHYDVYSVCGRPAHTHRPALASIFTFEARPTNSNFTDTATNGVCVPASAVAGPLTPGRCTMIAPFEGMELRKEYTAGNVWEMVAAADTVGTLANIAMEGGVVVCAPLRGAARVAAAAAANAATAAAEAAVAAGAAAPAFAASVVAGPLGVLAVPVAAIPVVVAPIVAAAPVAGVLVVAGPSAPAPAAAASAPVAPAASSAAGPGPATVAAAATAAAAADEDEDDDQDVQDVPYSYE